MTFGMNTTRDISKLSQISLALRLGKLCITILKYHLWYLWQISLQIMLLPPPPPGGLYMYLKIALKYKAKQSKNGTFPSNYKANPIDFKTQISLRR